MPQWSLFSVPNDRLLARTHELVKLDRLTTSELIAHLGEIEHRALFADDGFGCMKSWCMGVLELSEDAACRRLQAAHAARDFPILFEALEDKRLHLTAVTLLAPHLTQGNVAELVEAASHKGNEEIRVLLAQRFPRPDLETRI